jgi:ribosomal protein S18 acetylase RimI-like enzyme
MVTTAIRLGTLADVTSLLEVTMACASHMTASGIHQWNDEYPNKEAFSKDVREGTLYVLELVTGELAVAPRLIGCIVISPDKDDVYDAIEWLPGIPPKDKQRPFSHYYIHRLAVHPAFQKRGYATLLMSFAETKGKTHAIASIRLDTFSQNPRNIKFYEARGYVRLGNVYFPNKNNAPFHCYELLL